MPHTLEVSSQKEKQKPAVETENLVVAQKKKKSAKAIAYHKKYVVGYMRMYRSKSRWKNSYSYAKRRCTDVKCHYFKNGIKFLLTMDDVKKLWDRDGGDQMHSPSIDRIEDAGDYVFDNCRFIERDINIRRHTQFKTECVNGHPYTKETTGLVGHKNDPSRKYRFCKICSIDARNRYKNKIKVKEALQIIQGEWNNVYTRSNV